MKRVYCDRERPGHRTMILASSRDDFIYARHNVLCDEVAVLFVIVRRRERNVVPTSDIARERPSLGYTVNWEDSQQAGFDGFDPRLISCQTGVETDEGIRLEFLEDIFRPVFGL